jgi:hypothetical protein
MNSSRGKAAPKSSNQQRNASTGRSGPRPASRSSSVGPVRRERVQRSRMAPYERPSQSPAPVAQGTRSSATRPVITQRDVNSITITHREMVVSAVGSQTAFNANTIQQFPLNPGMSQTFPWLSNQSYGWERYTFLKLHFVFKTRVATSTAGSILMVPDYDAEDPVPQDELSCSSYQDMVEDVVWRDIVCRLTPASLHALGPSKFVRQGPIAFTDLKTYDSGNFFLATTDAATANVPLGKLWVEYTVKLMTPSSPLGGVISARNSFHAYGTSSTTTNPFANAVFSPGSNLALLYGQTLNSTSGAPFLNIDVPGQYLIVYTVSSTSVVLSGNPSISSNSTSAFDTSMVTNSGSGPGYSGAGSGQGETVQTFYVNVNTNQINVISAAGGYVSQPTTVHFFTTTVTGGTYWDLVIVLYPNSQF